MMGLPLGFAQPLVLLGLLSLPVLWWLLRLMPPRPRRVEFPPTRLLFDITPKEDTPSRTPWWLTLLRLILATLLILAAAEPLWNPPAANSEGGPIALLIDDGWSAAASWDARMRTAEEVVARSDANGQGVAIVPISEAARGINLQTPAAARVRISQIKPKPYRIERADALPAIARFMSATPGAELIWLSDGVNAGQGTDFVAALAKTLDGASIQVIDGGIAPAHALAAADNAAGALTVKVLRATAAGVESGVVRALDLRGLPLGEARFAFGAGDREADAEFDLPVEIRNDITRLEIASEKSAGAVQLLDKRWRRRAIGVASGTTIDTAQPLLASTFYLSRALGPFADVRVAERAAAAEAVSRFINQRLPMMILADVGNLTGETRTQLIKWVEDGGVLVRFAGPRLAAGADDLVPVRLRRGGRVLGGSLSWDKPQALAAFTREGPFNGMPVPSDVLVSRQVLAEPEAGLNERTWATLADGTPLVTAARRGKGVIVLFHVTADTRWSNLPLSGSFVEMLKRIVNLAGTTEVADAGSNAKADRETVPPTRLLDGFGAFGTPPATARPVPMNFVERASADHPPGFYGPPESQLAVNTLEPSDRLAPLDYTPLNAQIEGYAVSEPQDLRGPIFLVAMILLLIDGLVVFWLSGGFRRIMRRRPAAAALLLLAAAITLCAAVPPAHAQQAQNNIPDRIIRDLRPGSSDAPKSANPVEDFMLRSTLETKLAYVVTGDAETDAVSKAGLQGLTIFLGQRTALEAGEPVGLDISRDELSFFPLIYWPIVPGQPAPPQETLARIDSYMKQGGTILFDTRDAIMAPPGPGGESQSPGMTTLRAILSSLDIPELEPVPREHVLTKTFYLLRDFPGRFNTGQLWVEALPRDNEEAEDRARPARAGDGVSSILITSNDLAGAWAMRPDGQQMLPMVGGEPRQREFAYRAGVNIVMYTLTGNYKADQVHVPALLERLGQ
jgi:hypothetical protein